MVINNLEVEEYINREIIYDRAHNLAESDLGKLDNLFVVSPKGEWVHWRRLNIGLVVAEFHRERWN